MGPGLRRDDGLGRSDGLGGAIASHRKLHAKRIRGRGTLERRGDQVGEGILHTDNRKPRCEALRAPSTCSTSHTLAPRAPALTRHLLPRVPRVELVERLRGQARRLVLILDTGFVAPFASILSIS